MDARVICLEASMSGRKRLTMQRGINTATFFETPLEQRSSCSSRRHSRSAPHPLPLRLHLSRCHGRGLRDQVALDLVASQSGNPRMRRTMWSSKSPRLLFPPLTPRIKKSVSRIGSQTSMSHTRVCASPMHLFPSLIKLTARLRNLVGATRVDHRAVPPSPCFRVRSTVIPPQLSKRKHSRFTLPIPSGLWRNIRLAIPVLF